MHRVVAVAAVMGALAGGALAGYAARRVRDVPRTVPRTVRSEALERAWQAYEAGRMAEIPAALAGEAEGPEADLLRAVATGESAALEAVARRRVGTNAGALAEILLLERAADEEERRVRRAAFAQRYPRSWFNDRGAPPARGAR